jgi:glutamine synthetase
VQPIPGFRGPPDGRYGWRTQRHGRTPATLGEALDALEADHEFLLRGDVFTQDVIDTWIQTKREDELDFVRLRPHPAEFALYFNV